VAKEAGEPYGNIFTSTAGHLDSPSGKVAYEIYSNGMKWTESLFDRTSEEDVYDVVTKHSSDGIATVVLDFNHRQLGYTDEWLRRKIKDARAKGTNAEADFLNKWVSGTETSPIDKNLLKIIRDSEVQEPYIELSKSGYATRWYISEDAVKNIAPKTELVMGMDTSDAVGKDDIAMTIRSVRTGAIIGTGQYNETNLSNFTDWIIEMLERFPKLTLIIERRSSGVGIIDGLLRILPLKGIDPFKRIFNWFVDDINLHQDVAKEILSKKPEDRDPYVYDKYRKTFGYATSGAGRSSRNNLYGEALLSAIKYTGDKVKDKNLINQIAGLTLRNGRIDHASGFKDDLVISWMLSYWFLLKARNKNVYGISDTKVLSSVVSTVLTEKNEDGETKHHTEEQKNLKLHIETLLESFKQEKNPIKASILKDMINQLSSKIDDNKRETLSLESKIRDIELEKKNKKKVA
jgi:hypothetical protein